MSFTDYFILSLSSLLKRLWICTEKENFARNLPRELISFRNLAGWGAVAAGRRCSGCNGNTPSSYFPAYSGNSPVALSANVLAPLSVQANLPEGGKHEWYLLLGEYLFLL